MNTIDLFAGCGGMSLGFQQAGFNVVLAVEKWDKAVECYKKNFSHPVCVQNLTLVAESVKLLSSYPCDLIIGGPPCQDFSHAGQRVEGENANLTVAFAQIVCLSSPKYFIFENVDRARNSKSYMRAKEFFQQAGYTLFETVLDASYFNVPQKRKRFFAFGAKNHQIFEISNIIKKYKNSRPVTVDEYLGGELDIDFYYRHPRNYSRRAIFSTQAPSPTIRGVNRPIPPTYMLHPNDATTNLKIVRSLTTLERARIQTFPKDFIFTQSKTDNEQMIGNAVPVNLARFVAGCLLEFDKTFATREDKYMNFSELSKFRLWLENNDVAKGKVIVDIVSRAKRASGMIDLNNKEDTDVLLILLGKHEDFLKLSMSVKSQLRRAVRLFRKFKGF